MDPNNPVVKLCADGMQAEGQGRPQDARALFERAWSIAADDYEACIAAHYVARHQPDERGALHWNREALRRADAAGDPRVAPFYPSLHLNLGKSLEAAGDPAAACNHYRLAEQQIAAQPPSPYVDLVRRAAAGGCARVCSARVGSPR